MTTAVSKARAILQATKSVRFDGHPSVDLRDRLGLLTVVADLREIAAFGFAEHGNGDRLRVLKEVFSKFDLPTQITPQVRPSSHDSLGLPPELVEVFDRVDAESYEERSGGLLWICRNPKTREQIKRAARGEIRTGVLLGYPKCCVQQSHKDDAIFGKAFCNGIIAAVGSEPEAVERALREDLVVPLKLDSPLGLSLEATEERFPFVQHLACRACLSSDDSPSARLNATYEQLALEVDDAFHRVITEMSNLTASSVRISDLAESRALDDETLDHETRNQLESASRDQDRILCDFLRS